MRTDESVRRPPEIEEITNLFVIHPIAGHLTPLLARMRISANAVSVAGMACGLLAGAAYYRYQDVRYAVAGFVLMIVWHVMDGADGQLARLTHSQSQTGKVLDGLCDDVTFAAVYAALAAALSRTFGPWVWALAGAAGLCHLAQSAAYEMQRQEYSFFGLGRESARLVGPQELRPGGREAPPMGRLADGLLRAYVRLQFRLLAGGTVRFHQRLAAALEREPERAESLRQRYRETFAPAVRRWSVLSANYRTIGLFASALARAPQYYFAFEIVGFSAILAALMLDQQFRYARFLRRLETARGG